MDRCLEGKVAVISGGASGIGRLVGQRFTREGANVCLFDINGEKLRAALSPISSAAIEFQGDVTRFEDNCGAIARTVETFGKLDIFVGNAGVFDGFAALESLPGEILDRAFEDIFGVNVKGYFLGAKAAVPELLKTSGNMIFTVSSAGFYPDGGGPLYTASKHAVVGIIRQLAYELAPRVRVNGVAPGGTVTDLAVIPALRAHGRAAPDNETKEKLIRSRNPLRIAMHPQDHVAAYLLLASDQARAMTGEIVHVDGGLVVRGCSGPRV